MHVRDFEANLKNYTHSVYFDVSVNIWTLERGTRAGDGEIGAVMEQERESGIKNLRGTLGKVWVDPYICPRRL